MDRELYAKLTRADEDQHARLSRLKRQAQREYEYALKQSGRSPESLRPQLQRFLDRTAARLATAEEALEDCDKAMRAKYPKP